MRTRALKSEVRVTAPVGNGRLLAGLDGAGGVRTLTGPHLDRPQYLRSGRLGVLVAGGDRAICWLDGAGWRHEQSYLPGTNVLRTRSSHQDMGLELEQRAAAVGDWLLIGVAVSRASQGGVRLVWEVRPEKGAEPLANAYDHLPTPDVLVINHRESAFAVTCFPGSTGVGGGGWGKKGRPIGPPFRAVGRAAAHFEFALASGALGHLLCGFDMADRVNAQLTALRDRLAVSSNWPVELAPPPLSGATRAVIVRSPSEEDSGRDAAKECYARSILTIAQLTDRSGGLLGRPPMQGGAQRGNPSAVCWPRDGAFVAHALDVVGERGAARAFFAWALGRQPQDGIWKHHYYADGVVAPGSAEKQLDETGTLLWALDRHLDMSPDERLQRQGLTAAVSACRGIAELANQSGWPPVTRDVWDDRHGAHLYTLGALLAALAAWRQRAESLEDASAATLMSVEDHLRNALAGWPVDRTTGALARAVLPGFGEGTTDLTPDISLIGLSVPFGVLHRDDPRLQATVSAIESELLLSSGRVVRFRGDQYRGGDPWPLAGLWLSWHYATTGQRARAQRLYDRALADRTPAGLIAEQVDATSGEARWVVAMPWAHAWFLLVTHALLLEHRGRADVDYLFDNGTSVQERRRERALEGGLYHRGIPERLSDGEARVEAVTSTGLRPRAVTAELAGGGAVQLKPRARGPDGSRWQAVLRCSDTEATVRYRIHADLGGHPEEAIWATEANPRPGGQEFAYEVRPAFAPDWTADAIGYQIMVDRFARTGSEAWPAWRSPTDLYGGTFDGITEHLDHLSSLSVNLVWLSPVFVSPSHHGYDQDDHFEVEPRYGGEVGLKRLIEAAHSQGMRVILDYVPNHTGRGHPLFRRALQDADAAAVYRFWQWPHYYDTFFDHITLPELDTSRRQVQDYLVGVARRWLEDFEVDGLRCDHVSGVDTSFWIKLRRGIRAVNGSAFLLGEVSGSDDEIAAYSDRLDGVIDFGFARLVREAFARGTVGPRRFDHIVADQERRLASMTRATFVDNHDMKRFLWLAGGDTARLKLAAVALMTLPGMPMLYYGSEVGLSQRSDREDSNARMPMPWGAEQDHELLGHFQNLGQLRRSSLALRRGHRTTLLADEAVYGFQRSIGDESVWVLLNFSKKRQVRRLATVAMVAGVTVVDRLNMAAISHDGAGVTVDLPPLAAAVLSNCSQGGGD